MVVLSAASMELPAAWTSTETSTCGMITRIDEVGQHLAEAAARVAWHAAVEVAPVDRAHPAPGKCRGQVHRRQQDHLPAQTLRIEPACQPRAGDLSLVFVAVHAAGKQHRRPLAAIDDRNRDFDGGPGAAVARLRHAQITDLLARLVEIELVKDAAAGSGWGFWHGAVSSLELLA